MRDSAAILALNSGSSSLKFALYQVNARNEALLARGAAEGIGLQEGRVWLKDSSGSVLTDRKSRMGSHEAAIRNVLAALDSHRHPPPVGVGHRLVNGGRNYSQPQRITPRLVRELRKLIPLAPLHTPTELKLVAAITRVLPGVPQVACFDTAFHRSMPETVQRLPLPRIFWNEGLQRYGFHGLSYEYVVGKLGLAARRQRVIIAHLGNGASLAAICRGRSIDTSMGFTPTGGVIMSTRTGDLDPGVILYLVRTKHLDAAKLELLIDQQSGLLGISGTSSDMKALLRKRARDQRAREAVTMFCYAIRKQIGAFTAALGGLDTLVFTGGIGERAAEVRAEICEGLAHLGIRIAKEKNRTGAEVISSPRSGCVVRVMATNEELMIARHTYKLVCGRQT